jgi:hypothetical protein
MISVILTCRLSTTFDPVTHDAPDEVFLGGMIVQTSIE